MHMDVARANFYAGASRDIYVKLPAEDQHEGDEYMCGKLKKTMYGRRDTAQNWQRKCAVTAGALVFGVGGVSPSRFSRDKTEGLRVGARGRICIRGVQRVSCGSRGLHGRPV